jgi:hypothetical protein
MSQEKNRDEDKSDTRPSKDDFEPIRIIEREKTIRTIWIGAFITIGLITLTVGVVMALKQPPWVTALGMVLAALVGPTGVITVLLRTRRQYVQKTHRRIVLLEKKLDPDRESSDPSAKNP